ncbi:MAG: Holliday junction branch migration protein RuvA [Candidatus Kapabacteria bacterium]|nr:Holliday junction branch migration protein RuvA [Candidatus Kapabacteria bacterium]
MIARLEGVVVDKTDDEVIISCSGVGYVCAVSVATLDAITEGEEAVLHTYLAVREDALQLFGFSTKSERTAFLKLISISGIGGRTALGILSSISLNEFRDAVLTKNTTVLQKLPGVGKKTAERIVLELKDKLADLHVPTSGVQHSVSTLVVQQETLAALTALGYQRSSADKAIRLALDAQPTLQWKVEDLIRASLKQLSA